MAPQPKKSASSRSRNVPAPQTKPRTPANQAPEVVDPRWLLRMLGACIAAALVCGYLTLGLFFYIGSWQLVLHPARNSNAGTGLASEKIRFAPGRAGTPELSGEWIAAPANSTRSSYAVLYLRGSDGQLDAADGTQIAILRDLGLNVLAFDYHGYGVSAQRPHPSEQTMREDTAAAYDYLTGLRHIAPDHVLVFGSGVGVSLAAQLLQQHGEAAGLIAYNPDPDVLERVTRDARSHLFPLSLVFHDRFALDALKSLATPKLLYTTGPETPTQRAVAQGAARPKLTVEVPTHDAAAERAALARFLDANLRAASVPVLTPQMPAAK